MWRLPSHRGYMCEEVMVMFQTLARSWEFAKLSYGLLWEQKRLLVFPLLSGVAALVVTLSFFLPLVNQPCP